MKTLIQLFLFSTIIILGFFFYKNYLDINNNRSGLIISNEKFEISNKTEKSEIIDINKKGMVNNEIKIKTEKKN